jgi:hypothetical protein
MTKLLHETEEFVIQHRIHHLVVTVHLDPQSGMKTVAEHENGLLYHEIALLVPQVQSVAGDVPPQDLNLVLEVLPLGYHYYRPRSPINLVDDHIFSSAIATFLFEHFPLEISDCVSRNFIHR